MIDHAVLSFDSYARFFEDLFMGGARLNPAALGARDNRPDIRDSITSVVLPNGAVAPVGDLLNEFNFSQAPLPPLVLTTHIPSGIVVSCRKASSDHSDQCTSATVEISWHALTDAQVTGPFTYHVTRDGTELTACTGVNTTCTDVPGHGAHLYRVYSVSSTGEASPPSAAAEADVP